MAYMNGKKIFFPVQLHGEGQPTGTLNITEDGEYDVTDYASVIVQNAEIQNALEEIIGEVNNNE